MSWEATCRVWVKAEKQNAVERGTGKLEVFAANANETSFAGRCNTGNCGILYASRRLDVSSVRPHAFEDAKRVGRVLHAREAHNSCRECETAIQMPMRH